MASSNLISGVATTANPCDDDCMIMLTRPATKRVPRTQRIIDSWKTENSSVGPKNIKKEATTTPNQATNAEVQTNNSPSDVCSLCEESGTKSFLCDNLPNICNVCDKPCTAVDLSAIPELPRDIQSSTERMPEFCEACFKKAEPADLYSRLLPALDDNDCQTGESTIGVDYPGMGYVLDRG